MSNYSNYSRYYAKKNHWLAVLNVNPERRVHQELSDDHLFTLYRFEQKLNRIEQFLHNCSQMNIYACSPKQIIDMHNLAHRDTNVNEALKLSDSEIEAIIEYGYQSSFVNYPLLKDKPIPDNVKPMYDNFVNALGKLAKIEPLRGITVYRGQVLTAKQHQEYCPNKLQDDEDDTNLYTFKQFVSTSRSLEYAFDWMKFRNKMNINTYEDDRVSSLISIETSKVKSHAADIDYYSPYGTHLCPFNVHCKVASQEILFPPQSTFIVTQCQLIQTVDHTYWKVMMRER